MHGSNRKGQGKILSVEEWWKRVLHHRMRAKGVKEGFGAKISRIWCSAGTRMPDTAFVHHVCSFRIHANARSFSSEFLHTEFSLSQGPGVADPIITQCHAPQNYVPGPTPWTTWKNRTRALMNPSGTSRQARARAVTTVRTGVRCARFGYGGPHARVHFVLFHGFRTLVGPSSYTMKSLVLMLTLLACLPPLLAQATTTWSTCTWSTWCGLCSRCLSWRSVSRSSLRPATCSSR